MDAKLRRRRKKEVVRVERQSKKRSPLLRLVGVSIPTAVVLGVVFHVAQRFVVPFVVVAALLFGAMLLWSYANKETKGTEWWQDDDASGWRGY